jgi:hypothetical protein
VKIEDQIEKLKQARALVVKVAQDTEIPQLQAALWQANMNLHCAVWNLGEFESLMPDMPSIRKT